MPYQPNRSPDYHQPLLEADSQSLGKGSHRVPLAYLCACPRYEATPLHPLPGLARKLGLGGVYLKDEGQRLGLGSFKALGGAYAVMRLVHARAEAALGAPVRLSDWQAIEVREVSRHMTVCCATDGNHGKSVAAGARLVGCRAIIFVHAGVSDERVAAIAAYNAEIKRVEGTYDDAVKEARTRAEVEGWTLVSDTSWPGYESIPALVMQGYTVLGHEVLNQLADLSVRPTHVFLQAGVGGFAAAIAAYMGESDNDPLRRFIVVEPEAADCVYQSAAAGRLVKIAHERPTLMAMLECYEPSVVAMRILDRCADGFLTIPDHFAAEAMRQLAFPGAGDPAIVSGESGSAGLGGLMSALVDDRLREVLRLGMNAHVLLFSTETASDLSRYESIVGCSPARVYSKH